MCLARSSAPADIFALSSTQSELVDVLRKRRSRPDAYEDKLEATPSPKRSSAEMYDLRNTLPTRKVLNPDAQVRLVGTDATDLTPVHAPGPVKVTNDFGYESRPGLLSHSAARHKMAVRPKKKGPSRFQRPVELAKSNTDEEMAEQEPRPHVDSRAARLPSTVVQISEGLPVPGPKAAFAPDVHSAQGAPTGEPLLPSKSLPPHSQSSTLSGGVQAKPASTSQAFLEGLKATTRTSYSNLTKSEECLQESGRCSKKYGSHTGGELNISKTPAAAAPTSCKSQIFNGRRKSVEKSQSFKIFTHPSVLGADGSGGCVADRKELFNYNRPVSYKEFPKPSHGLESPKPAARTSILDTKVTGTRHAVDSILPIAKTNNIIQIEENIDKLVSNTFVPMLKKNNSIEELIKPKNNVSITNIGPAADVAPMPEISAAKPQTVHLRRRSSATIEKSPSVGSLNTLASEECKVPEFLRVHLNRVENPRPKSSSVLYKGTSDTLPRRFSRESLDATKPPLPPVLNVSTLRRPSINKSQETITESNHVIIVPVVSPRKGSVELSAKTDSSAKPEPSPGSPTTTPQSAGPKVTPPPSAKPDSESQPKPGDEFCERKGSVSEEKAKIERRLSTAEDRTVVRKKSIPTSQAAAKGANKDDNTPELMKVFARRSMKLKGDDEDEEDEVVQKSNSQSSIITDSDKENQSSSREELSAPLKKEEDAAPKEAKIIESAPYRARTFMEVKNMLQSTVNGNSVAPSNNKSVGLRTQRSSMAATATHDVLKKEAAVAPATNRHSMPGGPRTDDSDKLPEFKRILERRAEWESRAKMCK